MPKILYNMNRSNGASDSEVKMNKHNEFGYRTVHTPNSNKKAWVFSKMWSLIRLAAKESGCKISEVSKSEALKLAYECWDSRTIDISEDLDLIRITKGARRIEKVTCNPDTLKPNFTGTDEVESKSVLYVEFNADVYVYYFIDEEFKPGELTRSHFGFKQTAIFQTMKDRCNNYAEWEQFFKLNEESSCFFNERLL